MTARPSALLVACSAVLVVLAVYRGVMVPLDYAGRPTLRQDFDTFYFMAKAAYEHRHSMLDYEFLCDLAERDTGTRGVIAVTQPPFSIVPFVPLTRLPLAAARMVWHFLSLLTLLGILLVVGRGLSRSTSPASIAFAGVLLLALFAPLHHHLRHNQTNLLMVLLVASVLALECSRWKHHQPLAGFLLGFAIASKIFPAVVVPILVVRGRWRTIAWTVAAIIGLTVAALPLTGWQDYARYPGHLLDSYYFGGGASVGHNLSLKRSWLRILASVTSPPLETWLRPAWTWPLILVFFQAWRERSSSAVSFQLRFWQACLLMGTVMSSYWEYHLLFSLGAFALIADHAIRGEIVSRRMVAVTVIAFFACCIPTAMVGDVRWMGASLLVWLRSLSVIVLVLVLEQMARRVGSSEREAVAVAQA